MIDVSCEINGLNNRPAEKSAQEDKNVKFECQFSTSDVNSDSVPSKKKHKDSSWESQLDSGVNVSSAGSIKDDSNMWENDFESEPFNDEDMEESVIGDSNSKISDVDVTESGDLNSEESGKLSTTALLSGEKLMICVIFIDFYF